MPCTIELNDTTRIPLLTGCPADGESILFIGAQGGLGQGGYAVRSWKTIKSCILGGISFATFETIVGVDGIISVGDIDYVIGQETGNPVQNIMSGSVKVTIDSSRIYPAPIVGQIYAIIVFGVNSTVTTNFFNFSIDNPTENLGLQYGMKVIIDYAVGGATPPLNITTEDGFDLTTEDGQNITT